ncbi:PIN domain-containing protein [Luteolibacter arcticus]|uniref:Ribonuclease VapC n=1 Tax=Luteolibacter arcticus TaxID=1581411 RepID=A0ABT3GJA2_9BACT|nr:PIN domain-containing protein [Luteolibacter arcticus]
MDFLYDTNLWVALTMSEHPHHQTAHTVFANATTDRPACFCRSTQQGFLRLITTPVLLKEYKAVGFTNADALSVYAGLEKLPVVQMRSEPAGLEPLWHRLASLGSASPKVWMDAYLAAFAIGHGAELVTFDAGFKSFEKDGLKLRLLSA